MIGCFRRGQRDESSRLNVRRSEYLPQGSGNFTDCSILVVKELPGLRACVYFRRTALEIGDELISGATAVTLAGIKISEEKAAVIGGQKMVLIARSLVYPGEPIR